MISSIKISNFYSIGATQELSFEILPKDRLNDSAVAVGSTNINLVNCFVGSNASGKTTVLKAFCFLIWLITDSYSSMKPDSPIPVRRHSLHPNAPIRMELVFFNDNSWFQYKVELDRHQVIREFLGQKIKGKRGYTKIFDYVRSEGDWVFTSGPDMHVNEADLDRFKKRKKVSVLSSLIQTGYLGELLFAKICDTNVTSIGHFTEDSFATFFSLSDSLYANKSLQKESLSRLSDIDMGIAEFEFSEHLGTQKNETQDKIYLLNCVHESVSKKFTLPLIEESNGTQRSLAYLSKIIPILKTGGTVIYDEIESGLHPYVVKKMISLFENKETNPKNAQLIFSTHQHVLLEDRTKTQIFITEKENKNLETEVFRLDDIEGVRNDENYFRKYLSGTYGGTPDIRWT
jgi:uncharacterized protein